jgi:hypothetical protein
MQGSRVEERSAPDRRHRLEQNCGMVTDPEIRLLGYCHANVQRTNRPANRRQAPGVSDGFAVWYDLEAFATAEILLALNEANRSQRDVDRRSAARREPYENGPPPKQFNSTPSCEASVWSPGHAKRPPPETQCRGNSAITREASRPASCSPPLASSNILFATKVLGWLRSMVS